MQPYLKSTQILQCPSESNPPSATTTAAGYSDYGYNQTLGWSGSPRGLSMAALTQSSLTVLVNDLGNGSANSTFSGCANYNSRATDCDGLFGGGASVDKKAYFTATAQAQRHLQGANYAFADGHVKWYSSTNDGAFGVSNTVWGPVVPAATSGSGPTMNPTP